MEVVKATEIKRASYDRLRTDLLDIFSMSIRRDYEIVCGNCDQKFVKRLKTTSGISDKTDTHAKCKVCGALNIWQKNEL